MQHRRFQKPALLSAIAACLALTATAAEPIATAETNWDGVSVNVMSVARKGSILTVKFAAVNEGEAAQQVAFGFIGNDVSYAVDEESGTKYYVLTDEEGNPVASAKEWMPNSTHGINREVAPDKSLRVWMKLPAPPPEITAISLFLNETDPIENVPITDQ
jgi:hypothetical protein